MFGEKTVQAGLNCVLTLVFVLVSLPGVFSVYTFLVPALTGFEGSEANDFQLSVFNIVPLISNVPSEIATLFIAAFPAFILRTAFISVDGEITLSKLGKFGFVFLIIVGLISFIGSLCINPDLKVLTNNYASASVLIELKSLTVKCTYFCLFYSLMFSKLRPKP